MWCLRPSQIKPHQVSYVDVSRLIRLNVHSAEDYAFPTIGTDYNGPLEASNRYITGVTYD